MASDVLPRFESSAPAKAILAGEHSVVHGGLALAMPVRTLRARACVEGIAEGIEIEAPDLGLRARLPCMSPAPALAALAAAIAETEKACETRLDRFRLRVESCIPPSRGLGSGAAVAVACAKALAAFAGAEATDEKVSGIAFEVEKIHHGSPSGIDNATSAFERVVRFRKGSPLEFPHASALNFVLADSGPAPPTSEMVARARPAFEAREGALVVLMDAAVDDACAALAAGDGPGMGRAMDRCQEMLAGAGVSTSGIEDLCACARSVGAFGAKLTGAGGGGFILACVPEGRAETVAAALQNRGAARVFVTGIQ